ncbi:MAG TPA: dynamin family protein, partial [Stenomitos sp.]
MAAHGLETQSRDDSDDWSGWDEWLQQEGDEPIIITPPAATGFDPTAPVAELSEADLDEALSAFDTIQADLNYQQAHASLSALINRLDLKDTERAGLEAELEDLGTMLQKLEEQVVHIAVFGMVSRGKSSLLNALLGQSIFATGPVHGVTQHSQQTQWKVETPVPEDGDARRISLQGLGR